MSKASIYQKIKICLESKGIVPEDFVLEEREYKENELRFAPGALEGILGHHSPGTSDGAKLAEKIKEYLRLSPEAAMNIFEREEAGGVKVASARKGIQKEILEHREAYDAEKIFAIGRYFAANGTKVETVKLGLSLLALFDLFGETEVCNVLRVLGCCEEFTDYVLSSAEGWPENAKQELYFELAKKLHGWGKINAVERMEADSEEKKEWLLCHGCKNTIMYNYLGYVCAMKCDFCERLERGNLNEEEFLGAKDIMEGLLDEGPCAGISVMPKPVKLALLYLEECRKHPMDVDLVVQLADMNHYFEDESFEGEDASEVPAKVRELLDHINMEAFLAEHMKEKTHQCIRIAKAFGSDVSGYLFDLMKADFSKYYAFCYYLFEKEKYVDDFFVLCEREVDESEYPNEMGDSWGFGRERAKIGLDMIVQYLDRYPMCGKKMIRICLHSPITRWRNMAGKALLGWVKALGGTLADIDKDLYHVVEDVAARECNEGTKERWKELLSRQ